MASPRVLAFILAGGRGERLDPLTRDRGKPAVPFGGKYRIVDFVLSNFVNSGIYAIYVLVQYKAQSLIEHLRNAWRLGGMPDHFVIVVPPQMRRGEIWYQGTADAVFQNLNLMRDFRPDIVAIFGADHVYRMDLGQMLEFHHSSGAGVTVAALPMALERATGFGIIAADAAGRMQRFEEKPPRPTPMASNPEQALVSMGNYLFTRDALFETLTEDARRSTDHDFGRTIIPELVPHAPVYAYNFQNNSIPDQKPYEEAGYWRDIGTIGAYWEANMDLLGRTPRLDLANPRWPILTASFPGPSARVIDGELVDSLVGEGSRIEGATVRHSIIGRAVHVQPGAIIEDSLIMDHTIVESNAHLRRVIADRYNVVPKGTRIGLDADGDRRRFHVDPSGIIVLPRGATRSP